MAEHIYEAALTKTTTAAAVAIASIVPATLAAGVRQAEVREIGIFISPTTATPVGIGYPAAAGAGTATSVTVQGSPVDGAGHTTLVSSYATTQPTAPATYMRRTDLAGTAGSGVIFVWNPGEFILWSGAAINAPVIFQISAASVTYDIYVKVAE